MIKFLRLYIQGIQFLTVILQIWKTYLFFSSSLFDVRFIPVKGKEINQFDSLYVICLIIPDNINTVYSAKPQNEQHKFCYIYNARTGNVALNFNQVRHLAISFTEKRFPPLNS